MEKESGLNAIYRLSYLREQREQQIKKERFLKSLQLLKPTIENLKDDYLWDFIP